MLGFFDRSLHARAPPHCTYISISSTIIFSLTRASLRLAPHDDNNAWTFSTRRTAATIKLPIDARVYYIDGGAGREDADETAPTAGDFAAYFS